MTYLEAILLGFVEGFTEFLPVSSTGHLTILESALGYSVDDADITAFTAIIQVGAVFATLLYFRQDFWRIGTAWVKAMVAGGEKNQDYQFGWAVIIGSIPIGIVGLAFQDTIETTLRSLWFVGVALILWSFVM
ncbi:MAG: undecaprenyl-diphosphate phosphatase, partial [Solirubrobacteraceae bacterium]|nr:undecaprenyl-diphosphate phosphatase [Solirubrobacteraceae bacterium]